jgi:hypothetical protein
MAHRSEPDRRPGVVLQVGPGHPGQPERDLRVSPEHAVELRSYLEAEGLHVGRVIEFSVGDWLEVFSVFVGGGGAGSALVVALQKFIERHKEKNISFGPEGCVQSMTGFDAEDVIRVLRAVDDMQHDRDVRWRQIRDRGRLSQTDDGATG